ncbi:hypothetical protein NGB36_09690 [Streptomyces sp. RB6PN25]|uniref:Uncharacterized protein n=1 Tax=Streptomyces humicola TaxID=2953240 RepID=A0ABT1PT71_9ACTN|nr:hypothetical protein [Streptomyces humicola]MCQ4080865.1 hypothetical protein [Streptomyces humicola]
MPPAVLSSVRGAGQAPRLPVLLLGLAAPHGAFAGVVELAPQGVKGLALFSCRAIFRL